MKTLVLISLLFSSLFSFAQDENNIVETVDALTLKWDNQALSLKTYMGLQTYCSTKPYRDETIALLNEIHHYDTLLYGIVQRKYAESEDQEAKLTLKDIKKLEGEYTTKNFKAFIHRECNGVNEIERNYGKAHGSTYEKEVKKLEKELRKYVESITERIDIVDEHIHHLTFD